MSEAVDVERLSLDEIDVSQASLYQRDTWRPYFERLRREAPVHFQPDSPVGAFWSVSSHELIKAVDTNHDVFSSEAGGVAIADPPENIDPSMMIENFISMDPPRHGPQRIQRKAGALGS